MRDHLRLLARLTEPGRAADADEVSLSPRPWPIASTAWPASWMTPPTPRIGHARVLKVAEPLR
ncbi:hypothetical protein [Lysobacter niastensis]|uniref:hypothetical protein n=1 Tax=Lysobacter niastensis TaxID=380629 RepID=UPI003D2F743D